MTELCHTNTSSLQFIRELLQPQKTALGLESQVWAAQREKTGGSLY